MPKVTVTAPDGTKYDVTAPEGATDADIIGQVRTQWDTDQKKARETESAQELGLSMTGGGGGTLTARGMGELAKGAFREAATKIGGIDQTVLEGIGWGASVLGFPETSQEAFRRAKAVPGGVERKVESLVGPPTSSIEEQVGGIGGAVAPYLAMPGGIITQGIIGGATEPLKGGEDANLVTRLLGGTLGGLTGGALRGIGAGVGKIINMKGVEDAIKRVVSQAGELDPELTAAKKLTLRELDRLNARHDALTQEALRQGDTMGPIDTADARRALGRTMASAVGVKGADKAGMDLLTTTNDTLQLTRSGGAKYSQLRVLQDNLGKYLKENAESKNPIMGAVREAKSAIDAQIDAGSGPEVKALEKKAQRFYEKNISERYGNETVRGIMEETDPNKKAIKVLDVALGKDPEASGKLADLLGKNGVEGVNRAMMKKALDAATSDKGVIDPVKFVRFFDDKPGFTPFKMDRFDEMVKGFSKFIKSEDLLLGEARIPSLPRPHGTWGLIGTGAAAGTAALHLGEMIWRQIASGNFTEAALAVASTAGAGLSYRYLDKLMTDSFGRHLLIAMNRVPEGSPRWMRLVAQTKARFGGPAAGEAGGQGASALMGTGVQ